MNAARLTRRWQEAGGDPTRMVEALVDEINDPATGLVTRDFLRAELAELRGDMNAEFARVRGETAQLRGDMDAGFARVREELARLETRMIWRTVTLFGAQIALVGLLVAALLKLVR
jgi:hypothetical protein